MSGDGEWERQGLFSDVVENRLIFSVLDSFRQYRRAAHLNTTHVRRQSFYALSTKHWTLLSEPPFLLLDTFDRVDNCIDTNADIAEAIVASGALSLGLDTSQHGPEPPWNGLATKNDLDKARSTLHQLYRDWSAEAAPERAACFDIFFEDLRKHYSIEQIQSDQGVKVLVPGAGLGRLVFELCHAGFHVEGIEISYHQLLASSFMLNHTREANEWPLHPFAQTFGNQRSRDDQMRRVMIPDVCPTNVSLPGSMGMAAGDFCVVYRGDEYDGCFDAVVTLFFIDTAPNLIKYIETVAHCLKPGGIWANIGPLLWHWDPGRTGEEKEEDGASRGQTDADHLEDQGIGEAGSVELSHEEVLKLVKHFGFTITKNEPDRIETGYIQNPRSMLQYLYKPVHWVARKAFPDQALV